MSTIDIRTSEEAVNRIVFADKDERKRSDRALFISSSKVSPETIFLESQFGGHISVQHEDIQNLIKALEKADVLWNVLK